MKKFLQIIEKYEKKLVVEQNPAMAAPPPDPAAGGMEDPTVAGVPPTGNEPEKEEKEPEPIDVPAAVVTLSRLLKSALLIKNLSTEDEDYIRKLPEINQENATEIVDKIVPVISKYSPLDIKSNSEVGT